MIYSNQGINDTEIQRVQAKARTISSYAQTPRQLEILSANLSRQGITGPALEQSQEIMSEIRRLQSSVDNGYYVLNRTKAQKFMHNWLRMEDRALIKKLSTTEGDPGMKADKRDAAYKKSGAFGYADSAADWAEYNRLGPGFDLQSSLEGKFTSTSSSLITDNNLSGMRKRYGYNKEGEFGSRAIRENNPINIIDSELKGYNQIISQFESNNRLQTISEEDKIRNEKKILELQRKFKSITKLDYNEATRLPGGSIASNNGGTNTLINDELSFQRADEAGGMRAYIEVPEHLVNINDGVLAYDHNGRMVIVPREYVDGFTPEGKISSVMTDYVNNPVYPRNRMPASGFAENELSKNIEAFAQADSKRTFIQTSIPDYRREMFGQKIAFNKSIGRELDAIKSKATSIEGMKKALDDLLASELTKPATGNITSDIIKAVEAGNVHVFKGKIEALRAFYTSDLKINDAWDQIKFYNRLSDQTWEEKITNIRALNPSAINNKFADEITEDLAKFTISENERVTQATDAAEENLRSVTERGKLALTARQDIRAQGANIIQEHLQGGVMNTNTEEYKLANGNTGYKTTYQVNPYKLEADNKIIPGNKVFYPNSRIGFNVDKVLEDGRVVVAEDVVDLSKGKVWAHVPPIADIEAYKANMGMATAVVNYRRAKAAGYDSIISVLDNKIKNQSLNFNLRFQDRANKLIAENIPSEVIEVENKKFMDAIGKTITLTDEHRSQIEEIINSKNPNVNKFLDFQRSGDSVAETFFNKESLLDFKIGDVEIKGAHPLVADIVRSELPWLLDPTSKMNLEDVFQNGNAAMLEELNRLATTGTSINLSAEQLQKSQNLEQTIIKSAEQRMRGRVAASILKGHFGEIDEAAGAFVRSIASEMQTQDPLVIANYIQSNKAAIEENFLYKKFTKLNVNDIRNHLRTEVQNVSLNNILEDSYSDEIIDGVYTDKGDIKTLTHESISDASINELAEMGYSNADQSLPGGIGKTTLDAKQEALYASVAINKEADQRLAAKQEFDAIMFRKGSRKSALELQREYSTKHNAMLNFRELSKIKVADFDQIQAAVIDAMDQAALLLKSAEVDDFLNEFDSVKIAQEHITRAQRAGINNRLIAQNGINVIAKKFGYEAAEAVASSTPMEVDGAFTNLQEFLTRQLSTLDIMNKRNERIDIVNMDQIEILHAYEKIAKVKVGINQTAGDVVEKFTLESDWQNKNTILVNNASDKALRPVDSRPEPLITSTKDLRNANIKSVVELNSDGVPENIQEYKQFYSETDNKILKQIPWAPSNGSTQFSSYDDLIGNLESLRRLRTEPGLKLGMVDVETSGLPNSKVVPKEMTFFTEMFMHTAEYDAETSGLKVSNPNHFYVQPPTGAEEFAKKMTANVQSAAEIASQANLKPGEMYNTSWWNSEETEWLKNTAKYAPGADKKLLERKAMYADRELVVPHMFWKQKVEDLAADALAGLEELKKATYNQKAAMLALDEYMKPLDIIGGQNLAEAEKVWYNESVSKIHAEENTSRLTEIASLDDRNTNKIKQLSKKINKYMIKNGATKPENGVNLARMYLSDLTADASTATHPFVGTPMEKSFTALTRHVAQSDIINNLNATKALDKPIAISKMVPGTDTYFVNKLNKILTPNTNFTGELNNKPFLDTLSLSRVLEPELASHSLTAQAGANLQGTDLLKAYLSGGAHRADVDVNINTALIPNLIKRQIGIESNIDMSELSSGDLVSKVSASRGKGIIEKGSYRVNKVSSGGKNPYIELTNLDDPKNSVVRMTGRDPGELRDKFYKDFMVIGNEGGQEVISGDLTYDTARRELTRATNYDYFTRLRNETELVTTGQSEGFNKQLEYKRRYDELVEQNRKNPNAILSEMDQTIVGNAHLFQGPEADFLPPRQGTTRQLAMAGPVAEFMKTDESKIQQNLLRDLGDFKKIGAITEKQHGSMIAQFNQQKKTLGARPTRTYSYTIDAGNFLGEYGNVKVPDLAGTPLVLNTHTENTLMNQLSNAARSVGKMAPDDIKEVPGAARQWAFESVIVPHLKERGLVHETFDSSSGNITNKLTSVLKDNGSKSAMIEDPTSELLPFSGTKEEMYITMQRQADELTNSIKGSLSPKMQQDWENALGQRNVLPGVKETQFNKITPEVQAIQGEDMTLPHEGWTRELSNNDLISAMRDQKREQESRRQAGEALEYRANYGIKDERYHLKDAEYQTEDGVTHSVRGEGPQDTAFAERIRSQARSELGWDNAVENPKDVILTRGAYMGDSIGKIGASKDSSYLKKLADPNNEMFARFDPVVKTAATNYIQQRKDARIRTIEPSGEMKRDIISPKPYENINVSDELGSISRDTINQEATQKVEGGFLDGLMTGRGKSLALGAGALLATAYVLRQWTNESPLAPEKMPTKIDQLPGVDGAYDPESGSSRALSGIPNIVRLQENNGARVLVRAKDRQGLSHADLGSLAGKAINENIPGANININSRDDTSTLSLDSMKKYFTQLLNG